MLLICLEDGGKSSLFFFQNNINYHFSCLLLDILFVTERYMLGKKTLETAMATESLHKMAL